MNTLIRGRHQSQAQLSIQTPTRYSVTFAHSAQLARISSGSGNYQQNKQFTPADTGVASPWALITRDRISNFVSVDLMRVRTAIHTPLPSPGNTSSLPAVTTVQTLIFRLMANPNNTIPATNTIPSLTLP